MSEETPQPDEQPTGTGDAASESTTPGTRRVVVVGPDGQPIGQVEVPDTGEGDGDSDDGSKRKGVTDMVEQPAKVMRIGTMIKQLLEEVRNAPLDEASRSRLKEIYQQSITELEDGLAPELQEELERLSLPFVEDSVPSEGELRIAQAQLVGWLEGLFHGIQTALFAQQMSSRVALEQMRGAPVALPPGTVPGATPGAGRQGRDDQAPGQYL